MLIFTDIYMFGLKLLTGLLVVHDVMQFMKNLRLSALFLFYMFIWFTYLHDDYLVCFVQSVDYVHMMVSGRPHDVVWSGLT